MTNKNNIAGLTAIIAISMTLAACQNEPWMATSPEKPAMPEETTAMEQLPPPIKGVPINASRRENKDAGELADRQTEHDSGEARPEDRGNNAANAPDASGTPPPTNVFSVGGYGELVTGPPGSTAETVTTINPHGQITEAVFITANGRRFEVLVYEKRAGEAFADWMARAELGDAFISQRSAQTMNGKPSYIYESNDFGMEPDLHITINSTRFVYYVRPDPGSARTGALQDLMAFVQAIDVQ